MTKTEEKTEATVADAPEPEPFVTPKADHKVKAPAEAGDVQSHTIETTLGTIVIKHAISDRGDLEVVSAEVHDPATRQVNDVVLLKATS